MRRKIEKDLKVSPAIKSEVNKQMPRFQPITENTTYTTLNNYITPDNVMKNLDSNFESFFYQRHYTEENFCFYIQVLA